MVLRYITYFVLTMGLFISCKHTKTIQVDTVELPSTEYSVHSSLSGPSNSKIGIDDAVKAASFSKPEVDQIYSINKSSTLSSFDINGNFIKNYNTKFKATQIAQLPNFETKYKGKKNLLLLANNSSNSIRSYIYDSTSNDLEDITSGEFLSSVDEIKFIDGFYSTKLKQHFLIVAGKRGMVEQWALTDDGYGHVEGKIVRVFNLIDAPTAITIDTQNEIIYFAVQNEGIYKISAQPMGGTSATLLISIKQSNGLFNEDMGGLCYVNNKSKDGILIFTASNNSNNCIIDISSEKIISKLNISHTIGNEIITSISYIKTLDTNTFFIKSKAPEAVYIIKKKE